MSFWFYLLCFYNRGKAVNSTRSKIKKKERKQEREKEKKKAVTKKAEKRNEEIKLEEGGDLGNKRKKPVRQFWGCQRGIITV